MARPTHRLDLLLVPDLHTPIERGEAWLSLQVQRGVCDGAGLAGERAGALVEGGFVRLVLDRPDRPTLYANRLGGFRVRCPRGDEPLGTDFSRAVQAWRSGGERALHCPHCGQRHLLDELDIQPPAAFGPWAVAALDVASATWMPGVVSTATEVLGPLRLVARRT